MKWIKFETVKSTFLLVKEDDIERIVIDSSTGEGTVVLNNSCVTYDIIADSIIESGISVSCPLPDYDLEILRNEIQNLKLENDRLAKRDVKMRQVIRSIACDPDCEFCLLRGSDCSGTDMELLAKQTLKELEDL